MPKWSLRPFWFAGIFVATFGIAPCAAQRPPPSTGYITGSVMMPTQGGPTAPRREIYLVPTSPGGTTLGWMAGAGFLLFHNASFEVELLRPGRVGPLREGLRYDTTTTEERRDLLITVGMRFHFLRHGPIEVQPSAGLLMASTERWSQSEQRDVFGTLHVGPPGHEWFSRAGLTAGIDLAVAGAPGRPSGFTGSAQEVALRAACRTAVYGI